MFLSQSLFIRLATSILIAAMGLTSALFYAKAHDGNEQLAGVVLDRAADKRARDASRHPVQTLSFFHLEPSMRVAEALPGTGWYSEIIANYLGENGALYGINYNESMWPLFGFFTPERIEQMSARTAAFPELVANLADNGITAGGFTFDTAPKNLNSTLDRVLFVRALHNLARFESEAGTLSQALKVTYELLKDDGLVGVVQHRAPANADDKWADGSAGYLKESFVIERFEDAGFELVAKSEINANSKDKPTTDDIVWRLPPSFNGTGDDPAKRAAVEAIGESDRMTLLFKKKGAKVRLH
ncbi:class I SAM-dependent methyltransferase [Glaciecola siphonariae]|uniref:Class I SAM-dependent methyltransferase n=1 Tax=Glaciecola siphonariae TaxID=521012 RepID=A0ABV9LTE2_9ALTE